MAKDVPGFLSTNEKPCVCLANAVRLALYATVSPVLVISSRKIPFVLHTNFSTFVFPLDNYPRTYRVVCAQKTQRTCVFLWSEFPSPYRCDVIGVLLGLISRPIEDIYNSPDFEGKLRSLIYMKQPENCPKYRNSLRVVTNNANNNAFVHFPSQSAQ